MRTVHIGNNSLRISIELALKKDDETALVLKGVPNSSWSISIYAMPVSGSSLVFCSLQSTLNLEGNFRHSHLGQWKDGLHLCVIESVEPPPESVTFLPLIFPHIPDWNKSFPFWIGENLPTNIYAILARTRRKQAEFKTSEIVFSEYTGSNCLILHVLVDGCLLDYQQDFQGGQVSPLDYQLKPSSIVDAVHSLMPPDIRFNDTAALDTAYASSHPLCLITFINVRAPNHRSSIEAVQTSLSRVLSALAEDRSSSPQVVAYFSEIGGSIELSVPRTIYSGNLMRGFGPV